MTIFTGWREQYWRMRRSRDRLAAAATGQLAADSDEARDRLVHFYQDAYHLKDWLKNDPVVPGPARGQALEQHITPTSVLALCADIANGAKHLLLKSSRTHDSSTGVTSQSVTLRPATVVGRAVIGSSGAATPPVVAAQPQPALHSWIIESNGQTYDALVLADQVIAAWDGWLHTHQLVP
jgi:hypothetical protein